MRTAFTKLLPLSLLMLCCSPGASLAQEGVFHMNFSFDGVVNCTRPVAVQNFTLHGSGRAVLYSDGRATLDYTQRGVTSTQVKFDAKLGGAPTPAPGGTASLRVVNRNQLRAVWSLPNNNLILNVSVGRNSCVAKIDAMLKGGARQYSLFDSGILVYCGRPTIANVSCRAN